MAGPQWPRDRVGERLGQFLEGTVEKVPRPGAIGIFVDIGLSVGGFVDVLLFPEQSAGLPPTAETHESIRHLHPNIVA